MRGWTVGDLKHLLRDLPDEMEITVRGEDEQGDASFCGAILSADVEEGCDGKRFLAIDATEDADLLEASREDVDEVE